MGVLFDQLVVNIIMVHLPAEGIKTSWTERRILFLGSRSFGRDGTGKLRYDMRKQACGFSYARCYQ